MINWRYDTDAAKTGDKILVCTKDNGTAWLGFSRWLDAEQRFMNLASKQTIYAWSEVNHADDSLTERRPEPQVAPVTLPDDLAPPVTLPPGMF